MATHSSIIDWKISWTEEPGGLQSMGSQRVGHNRVTNTYLLSPKSKGMSFMWDSPHRVSLHGLLVTSDFGEWTGSEATSPQGELVAAISMGDRTGSRTRQGWAEASSGLSGDWWPVGDKTGAGDTLLSWPHFPWCLWWLMAISPSVGSSAKQERLEEEPVQGRWPGLRWSCRLVRASGSASQLPHGLESSHMCTHSCKVESWLLAPSGKAPQGFKWVEGARLPRASPQTWGS